MITKVRINEEIFNFIKINRRIAMHYKKVRREQFNFTGKTFISRTIGVSYKLNGSLRSKWFSQKYKKIICTHFARNG